LFPEPLPPVVKTEIQQRTQLQRLLRSVYGLTLDDYDAMLKAQSGRCAICRLEPPEGKRLCVDHCHKSTKVRALLCQRCNTLVGYLEKQPEHVEHALAYVRRFAE
jgi:hypothetical protein